ncbi:hypothetical protein F4774DRAFT_367871 [Daldinia eschscholtzii]|nr:hypothetical protein F4774DRAFT_367871 [Daldinia eschscholtzii]
MISLRVFKPKIFYAIDQILANLRIHYFRHALYSTHFPLIALCSISTPRRYY